ncbi:unnamed protein product [Gadus morhua 'NCC']
MVGLGGERPAALRARRGPGGAPGLMENVLAAERPPDAPPQEVGGAASQEVGGAASQEVGGAEGVLPKDNFLLATFDPWKGKHRCGEQ